MKIKINYEPLEWAKPFHEGDWRHAALAGGLGGGKTVGMIRELQACALENPGFTYLIGRKTLPSLRDTTMKTFFQVVEPELIRSWNKANLVCTLINNAEFIFRPLDDLEKMKSLEVAGIGVDEANEISKDMYDTLKSRVRQKVNGKEPTRYRTIIALNPTEEDHWIPQLFLHVKPEGSQLFTSTTFDNIKNLPAGYIKELEATYTKDMQQRMIYGLFGKIHKGRPVYPQFQRGNYVFACDYKPSLPLIRSWDFGYNHPAVCWLQMENQQIRILAELMGSEIYLDDFVTEQVLTYERSIFGERKVKGLDFCDPRGSDATDKGKSSVEILREKGIYPYYRRTWIEEGLKAIKRQLDTVDVETKQPNLLVHPRCKIIIEGFRGGYARVDGEELPRKDDYYDHLQDCVRYAVIHCVQRSKIAALNNNQAQVKVFISPKTGRRIEY